MKNDTPPASHEEDGLDEHELIAQRKAKLAEWRQSGRAFPNQFRPDALADDLNRLHADHDKAALTAAPVRVRVAGRMMLRRIMGKASFATLQDRSGRIQIYLRNSLPDDSYEAFKRWDLGDIIGVEGVLFRTNSGELTIEVERAELLTKSLRPLPDKHKGLVDQESRYRQRYLDLMVNEQTRRLFQIRSRLIEAIRHFMVRHDFIEVETPMMQVIPGGATARPFTTHHHALDMPLYLRIAPELYLKRLVVGGFERVFEINRNFRNEGLSTRHNPEFTMIEFYLAYADYHDLMNLTETMLRTVAEQVLGTPRLHYQGIDIDLAQPFARMTLLEALIRHNPELPAASFSDRDRLAGIVEELGIAVAAGWGLGKLQMELFEKSVEHRLLQPTFITCYPTEVSPLARRSDSDPSVSDRFEFFVGGREIANGFSELNDPEDQAERFRSQVADKERGDEEAMFYDEDYITALEYGLPPTAGEGIGIDRLVMLFTDSPSIRDVLLFPHMRPLERR
ncbi:MAG TPA: lysine--tRNA ligase [Pseudomonadales bacterium]|nr:lysine--tRNA ligase [Pseudomonadales bacterium]